MQISDRELLLINDREFLLTKNQILQKISELLSTTRDELQKAVAACDLSFPDKSLFRSKKISRGEQYCGLPYLVLDYPAVYGQKDVYAFRTMFWWGNFFSISFHLQGTYFDRLRPHLDKKLPGLAGRDFFLCVHDTPWEYHFGEDNYQPLTTELWKGVRSRPFLKIARKFALEQWEEMPVLAASFVSALLALKS